MIKIYDISNIYKQQSFYKEYEYCYHDLSSLSGLSCYCDPSNIEYLSSLTYSKIPRLHFIDSGNYHYISYMHLQHIRTDFKLILFDNHPDAKKADFPLLSCGSWVLDSLKNVEYLKYIDFRGTDPLLMDEVKQDIINKGFTQKQYDKENRIYRFQRSNLSDPLPIYLSIDKDVLSENYARTSWTHGIMNLSSLICITGQLIKENEILGIDICGESDLDFLDPSSCKLNEDTNRILADHFTRLLRAPKIQKMV